MAPISERLPPIACPAHLPVVITTGGTPAADTIDVVKDRLGSLGIPVVYGFPFGHIREQLTIPIGIMAELDTDKMSLRFTEKAVH
jgi:muramoyltetrapeptide carboxypeptidase LdcA involved in peptidoglycan recycling